jgi:hypothetical protein
MVCIYYLLSGMLTSGECKAWNRKPFNWVSHGSKHPPAPSCASPPFFFFSFFWVNLFHWVLFSFPFRIESNFVGPSEQVLEAAGKHQVLIFVHSRKETSKTARFLKEEALKEDKLALFMGGVRSNPGI